MSKCKECKKYDICAKRELFGSIGCNNDFQQKNYTQADKIRSMSDEELAEYLTKMSNDSKDFGMALELDECMQWLQSEVSDGN